MALTPWNGFAVRAEVMTLLKLSAVLKVSCGRTIHSIRSFATSKVVTSSSSFIMPSLRALERRLRQRDVPLALKTVEASAHSTGQLAKPRTPKQGAYRPLKLRKKTHADAKIPATI